MPIAPPPLDERRYAQLVDETLARAPVHTPEWTNFNQSDPGVTLVQLFAFLTENLLFRANQVPLRNRAKFLELLRVPLAAATAATGLVTINNTGAAPLAQTLPAGLQVRAGEVPFLTSAALDVLPVQARVMFKRKLVSRSDELLDYYRLLYASYQLELKGDIELYESVALDHAVVGSVDLHVDSVDHSLWIALLAREGEVPDAALREQLAGRTLMLGVVPALDADEARLQPAGTSEPRPLLHFELPAVPADGRVPRDAADQPAPNYRALVPRTELDVLTTPGVVQLTLPGAADLRLWADLDPLEAGVGEMPPTLDDPALSQRLVTWLRVRADTASRARLQWVGINAVPVRQLERISSEVLTRGDGNPDQVRQLARAPVLRESVRVTTRSASQPALSWQPIDDLAAAGPEVAASDPRLPPHRAAPGGPTEVFELDPEAGRLRFGDGLRGRRLPLGAEVWAAYDFCAGAAGNVAAGAINSAAQLPSGFVVRNPVSTWGGADAERVDDGERQVRRTLQHHERLVSIDDFEAIACRTPGVQLGRIEVLPAFHPDLQPAEPGGAPGVVTVMAIPRFDAAQPDAPRADRMFLAALCRHLDPRRLVTTELIVRGPTYKGVWISVGIEPAAGASMAQLVDDIKQRLRLFLLPIGPQGAVPRETPLFTERRADAARGWPLRAALQQRVLLAEVARVAGVLAVNGLLLAEGNKDANDQVPMTGLELPQLLGVAVVTGEPMPLGSLRGLGGAAGAVGTGASAPRRLPVPVIPESC